MMKKGTKDYATVQKGAADTCKAPAAKKSG
jgi:hypothetical protein